METSDELTIERAHLNGQDVVNHVHELEDRLELPRYSFVVLGGAALALWGLKEAGDIDVSASVQVMDRVRRRLPTEQREGACGTMLDTYEQFEMANGWGSWTHSFIRQNSIHYTGVSVVRLARVFAWKLEHSRNRDAQDAFGMFRYATKLRSEGRNAELRRFMVINRLYSDTPYHDCEKVQHYEVLPRGSYFRLGLDGSNVC